MNNVNFNDPDGINYSIAGIEDIKGQFAGSSPQFKATLRTSNGAQRSVRVKHIKNVNEAVVNQRIFALNDPLKSHLPCFYGAFDKEGRHLDGKSLEKRVISLDGHGYTIMEDLKGSASHIETEMSDFKFVRSELLEHHEENEVHGHRPKKGLITKIRHFIRRFFSFCSLNFVHPKIRGSLTLLDKIKNVWNYLRGMMGTEEKLKSQFEGLSQDELQKTVVQLRKMKEDVENSNFTFPDGSLLFIKKKNRISRETTLDIRLIDMNHAMEKSENIQGFDGMKKAAVETLGELIRMASKIESARSVQPPFYTAASAA
ncbi:MAG: hypothetical protein JSS32_05570 [Verrucomicrobia bacterium]|nr:hypothetical protein [Verrucomicrobiota bacterium]